MDEEKKEEWKEIDEDGTLDLEQAPIPVKLAFAMLGIVVVIALVPLIMTIVSWVLFALLVLSGGGLAVYLYMLVFLGKEKADILYEEMLARVDIRNLKKKEKTYPPTVHEHEEKS